MCICGGGAEKERERGREVERGAIIEKLSGLPIPGSLPTSPHPHSASWDLLPNKLLAVKSLSQALLLGESKLRHRSPTFTISAAQAAANSWEKLF